MAAGVGAKRCASSAPYTLLPAGMPSDPSCRISPSSAPAACTKQWCLWMQRLQLLRRALSGRARLSCPDVPCCSWRLRVSPLSSTVESGDVCVFTRAVPRAHHLNAMSLVSSLVTVGESWQPVRATRKTLHTVMRTGSGAYDHAHEHRLFINAILINGLTSSID